jgi:hypothetical protein
VLPDLYAKNLTGICGASVHVAEGTVSITGVEAALLPAALIARSDTVYAPAGTPENEMVSPCPSGTEPLNDPVTSSTMELGAPPAKVFLHESATVDPCTIRNRSTGADGATGTFTWSGTSFDASLTMVPYSARIRTRNDPVADVNV